MRKSLALCAAAALAAGSLTYVGYQQNQAWADNPSMTGSGTSSGTSLPQGITRSEQTDTQGITSSLASAVDAIFAPGGPQGFTNYLSQSDRQRLGNTNWQQNQDLNNKITQFRNDWKAKYNQDFNVSQRHDVVFANQPGRVEIVQGEITNPTLLSNWPVEPTKGSSGQQPGGSYAEPGGPGNPPGPALNPGPGGTSGTGTAAGGSAMTSRTFDRGQTVAVVTFPANQGAPELTVSLVKENAGAGMSGGTSGMTGSGYGAAGGTSGTTGGNTGMTGGMASGDWRIDAPDSLTGDQLRDNLARHLDMVESAKNQWPADPNEAYRFVSQHLLHAVYDTGGVAGHTMTH